MKCFALLLLQMVCKLSTDNMVRNCYVTGLASDHVLPDDPICRPMIDTYAANQRLFFADFAAAYAKLTELGCAL